MELKDYDRLLKVLTLTTSSMDGEALAAIRKANELLRKHNLTWEAVISIQTTITYKKPPPKQPKKDVRKKPYYDENFKDVWERYADEHARREKKEPPANKSKEILDARHMLSELCYASLGTQTMAYIDSLRDKMFERGYLTEKEQEELYKIYKYWTDSLTT